MIGETISRYEIVAKIGAGGMGEVYRARDPRLARDVAIKVLPSSFAERADRLARFEQEARAAGALNHPNILAIHDVGREGGVPFLVSELLEGETLRDSINSGLLSRRKAVDYAAQVADGLAAAHANNIIHRDLKPENVFITRAGHAKILDFGLAKLTERDPQNPVTTESPTEALTASNMVVGTPSYMSPEQLHGDPADHRSDIFSFGVMLYEMITGRKPFTGATAAEVSASILRDDPAPMSDAQKPVPPTLDRLVRQCLEKRPDDRFESAHDLAHVLRAVSDTDDITTPLPIRDTKRRRPRLAAAVAAIAILVVTGWELLNRDRAPPIPETKHIAVLPLEAAGDDSESRFLAAGLAASIADGLEIIERHSRGSTWVIPPDPDLTLEEAHKQSNVNLGIRGEFGHDEERLHLDLQAVDPETGHVLARRTLDENIRNITSLQRQPILLVWEMLGIEARPEASSELESLSTNSLAACRAYLSGRGRLVAGATEPELMTAAELLEQAVREDPRYGPARVALAKTAKRLFDMTEQQAWRDLAVSEANRSIELMRDDPEPYLALSLVYESEHDTARQLQALRQAASVSRTADAHVWLGIAATDAELYEEAESSFHRAINLRPESCEPHLSLGYLYVRMGRYDAAANEFRHAAKAAPSNEIALINLGTMLYYQGLPDEARTAFENAVEAGPPNVTAYSNLGTIYFEQGRFGDAADTFSMAVNLMGDEVTAEDHTYVANYANALYWGGDRDGARPQFERAIELAELRLSEVPGDPSVMADLAGYFAMVGNRNRGLELLEEAVRHDIRDAHVMAAIGESFEDLDDRDRAIEWIGKALEAGLEANWIDRRPSLNSLREDPRYEELVR